MLRIIHDRASADATTLQMSGSRPKLFMFSSHTIAPRKALRDLTESTGNDKGCRFQKPIPPKTQTLDEQPKPPQAESNV
jgi:hypothetical protein